MDGFVKRAAAGAGQAELVRLVEDYLRELLTRDLSRGVASEADIRRLLDAMAESGIAP